MRQKAEPKAVLRGFSLGLAAVAASVLCSPGTQAEPQGAGGAARPHQVTVIVDAEIRDLPTSAATVGELLATLEITLGALDRTHPSPDTPLAEGLEIRVTRVACREVTEDITLQADTFVLADPDRRVGPASILVQGQHGLLRRVWRIWEKDGEVTSRTMISEELVSPRRDRIVMRGARGIPTRAGYWQHWRRPLQMEATAYDPGPRSCGKWATGYTATGLKAQKGIAAVDPNVIPMGTRLYVPGYGPALAADRGGAIKGMRIDLCFATYEEAMQFGRRPVKVYLLD